MLIVMEKGASEEQIRAVTDRIRALGLRPHPIPGAERTAIGITGNHGPLEPALRGCIARPEAHMGSGRECGVAVLSLLTLHCG